MRSSIAILLFVAACGGPATLQDRMNRAEKRGQEAETLLDDAEKKLDALEPDRAESLIADAKELLADPDISKYPEHRMLQDRAKADEARLTGVREEVARRELEKKVAKHRQLLEAASAKLEQAIAGLKRPDFAPAQVRDVKDAIGEVDDQLEEAEAVEKKDSALAEYDAGLRKKRAKAQEELKHANDELEFREGPLAARKQAEELAERAKAEKDLEKKREYQAGALEKTRACATKGKELVARSSDVAKAKMEVDGKTTTPEAVTSACAKQVQSLEKQLQATDKQLAAKAKQEKKKPKPETAAKPKKKSRAK